MNKWEEDAFKHFIDAYKTQWDLNRYNRDNYDDDLEYYSSYRPKQRYPLAYNASFNKLLPKTMTILSRFMEQLYQAGTANLISVRPRKKSDVDRAPRVEGLLNYQLECLNDIDMQGGSYLFNFQWMFNAINWGKGISKLYWKKEERIAPRRYSMPVPQFDRGRLVGVEMVDKLVQEPQILYDGPYAEVIHNKLFVPHPYYKNIQLMPNVFVVYRRSIDYIREMAKRGVYNLRNLRELGWSSQSANSGETVSGMDSAEEYAKSIEIEGAIGVDEIISDRKSPDVDIIEGYGKYIWPEDETPYEVGSGMKIKDKESETIIHVGNYKTILKMQKNMYGYRPFFDISAYYHPEMFWDIGVIRLGKSIQEVYNDLGNLRTQNAMMLVNQMLKVREDADINPESLVWKPFGVIPVEEMNDVDPLVIPDINQQVFESQEKFFNDTLSDMTGMYPYNQGMEPHRQEHVGTIYSIQAMGEARTKLLMMTMDHMGFRPFLKYMMLLNTWHLPSKMEARINSPTGQQFTPMFGGDIHPNYDFSARYTGMEPALGKQFRAQQLIQYAQMWAQSPYLQHHQFMTAILELMDFHNTEQYIKSPQQVQQEQQQQQMMMMRQVSMQEQAKSKLQGEKIAGDIAKELIK